MVNLEKLAALTAAINAGNTEKAQSIANEEDVSLAKRADNSSSAASGWVNEQGTTVPLPIKDTDFYTFLTPEDVESYELGDIIKHREVGVANASFGYKAYQLMYRSENSTGFPVGALTTIVVPDNNKGENVVVYPQAEDSAYINCASSYNLLTKGIQNGMDEVLEQGWVLAIPDHEGFNSSFTAGILEGKLTLDSIRALEKSRDITGIENNKYAIAGYSGGSVAAGWAAELQESYAPDLNIVAYSMGGFVNNLTAVIEKVNKTPYFGFVPAGIMGLASEYPQMWDLWDTELNSTSASSLSKALNQCSLANILQYAGQDISTFFKSGTAIFDNDIIAPILKNNTLRQHTPKVPMLIYNGVSDQIVPIETVDEVVDYYCSNGASLVYNRGKDKDHIGMATVGLPLTFEFFENAFNGDVPSGCSFDGVAPDFARQYTGSYDGFNSSNSSDGSSNSTKSTGNSSESSNSHSSGSGPSSTGTATDSAAANAASYIQPASLGLISLVFALL